MERVYYNGDRQRTVEELENVIAVLPEGGGERTDDVVRSLGRSAPASAITGSSTRSSTDAGEEVVEGGRDVFEAAGWVFVAPSADTRRSLEAGGSLAGTTAVAKVYRQEGGRTFIGTQRISVRLNDELSPSNAEAILTAAGVTIDRKLNFAPNLYEVTVAAGRDAIDVSVELHGNESVIFAEPQFIEHIPQRFTPTDTDYTSQWHLNNTGQDGGTAGADIEAETAWDSTRGNGIRLSVVDNGFDVTHPDIAGAIVAGGGFFQSDGMGGANFVSGLASFPDSSHGTFCAGIAIARANNSEGGVGVANAADFLPVACLGDQVGTQMTLARAIAYAADPTQEVASADPGDGADVISCSLGPNGADWDMTATLQTAIDFAVTNGRGGLGTPIFWAVTNGNFELIFDEVCSYANTIHVGRSTRDDVEDDCGHGPELDFLATGVDVFSTDSGGGYTTSTGTSFAAPTAAGVGALVLAVNPDLTWQQVRQTLRDTAEKIGGATYDGTGHNDDYGWGRVNAADAVCAAANLVELNTPTITFNDVPEGETTARAIVFSVQRCDTATFQIISGPSVTSGPGSFGTLPSPTASLPAVSSAAVREARLWLSFTGVNDGDVTGGTVTVRLVETGDEWIIPITANTIARPTVAVALVLDQSGSMADPSGVPSLPTRNDVLHFAAPVFVNVLPEDDGIGIVAFDTDAYDRMAVATVSLPSAFDPVRATALTTIASHVPNPAGMTAIGDGLESAQNLLAPVTGFDHKATVVFTDGHETASKYISDVAPSINERVFAIGLGTADQLQPAALSAIANGTGGYLLMTGALGNDDLFRLSKYYLQILAGVTNHDIVLDPDGYLLPGQVQRIPFRLNEADIETDVILLSDWPPSAFVFGLETPAGDLIAPSSVGALGGQFVTGNGVSYFRMTLPVALGAGAHAGKWHAVLAINPRYGGPVGTTTHVPDGPGSSNLPPNGLRYSLSVHSYSGLRLQGSVSQTSNQPGAMVTIRGILTEYGVPIESDRAMVTAELEYPDGSKSLLNLWETSPGIYEATFNASQAGVYPIRILAKGSSMRGRAFTREHLLSAATWQGGDRPPPTSDDPRDPAGVDPICKLIACLFDGKVFDEKALKKLAELGVDIEALRRCLVKICRKQRRDGAVRPTSVGTVSPGVFTPAGSVATVANPAFSIAGLDDQDVKNLLETLGSGGVAAVRSAIELAGSSQVRQAGNKASGDCGCGSHGENDG